MDEELKNRIVKMLEKESDNIKESSEDNKTKLKRLHSILHLLQILDRFEELEPVIQEYLNREADKRRFENCDR